MEKLFYLTSLLFSCGSAMAQEIRQLAVDKPAATADLKTTEGAAILNASWYVQPARVSETEFRLPGPDAGKDPLPLYATGEQVRTNQLSPQAGMPGFEEGFVMIQPADLEKRLGHGRLSFVWYKVDITLPERIGSFPVPGGTVVFEIVVDDYSEVWVNGQQQIGFGQSGSGAIAGYNTRNRVVLTDQAKPGQQFSIAVLGINGVIGKLPDNYIWIRNAVVDFYPELPVPSAWKDAGRFQQIDPSLQHVIDTAVRIEKIAEGFSFTEGPTWHPEGYLLFSDPNTNTIYRYQPQNHNISVYMSHSGYAGTDIGLFHQPGSNGLAVDQQGRLLVNQHGNRRVIRLEKKGPVTVMADNYLGRKLNSPNDLVLKSDGSIYFTDPPYGLPGSYADMKKELPFAGVFMIRNGKLHLLDSTIGGPNGIAFSPDEKYLYVSNWDTRNIHRTKFLWQYEVLPGGTLKNKKLFFDFSFTPGDEALDGIKVDREGNLFVSAPGGIWVLSAAGKLLGKIITPERPANMAWGDSDGKTLYMTAHGNIYKVRIKTGGKFSWQ